MKKGTKRKKLDDGGASQLGLPRRGKESAGELELDLEKRREALRAKQ